MMQIEAPTEKAIVGYTTKHVKKFEKKWVTSSIAAIKLLWRTLQRCNAVQQHAAIHSASYTCLYCGLLAIKPPEKIQCYCADMSTN